MKTAFFLTDCSVDSALVLRRWREANPDEAIRLTVVHPYDIETGVALSKETYRQARQQAAARLERWLGMTPQPWLGAIKPETLLAPPALAIDMHRLLRSYDYLLIDWQTFGLPADTYTQLTQPVAQWQGLVSCDHTL